MSTTTVVIMILVVLTLFVAGIRLLILSDNKRMKEEESQLKAKQECKDAERKAAADLEERRLKQSLGSPLITDWKYCSLSDTQLARLKGLVSLSDKGTTLRFWDDQMTADFGIQSPKDLHETFHAIICKDTTFWYRTCYGDSSLGQFLFDHDTGVFTYHNVLWMAQRVGEVKTGRRGQHIEVLLTPIFSRVSGASNLVPDAEGERIANQVSKL